MSLVVLSVCVCDVNLWVSWTFFFQIIRCYLSKSSQISGECDYTHGNADCTSQAHPCQISSDTRLSLLLTIVRYLLIRCGVFMQPRRNLRGLTSIDEGESKNCGRRFWSWLHKQPWRAMLPSPHEFFGCTVFGSFISFFRNWPNFCLTFNVWPRVQVVTMEPSRKEPLYLGEWHMFLPSDVTLVQISCVHSMWHSMKILSCNFHQTVSCNTLFHQDNLFRERWLGPPGVTWQCYLWCLNFVFEPPVFLINDVPDLH